MLLSILIAIALFLAACQKQATAPPPPTRTLPVHGPGEVQLSSCTNSTGHGAPKPIDCPEVCKATVQDHVLNVDDYIANPNRDNDPDICMHFGGTETLTYTTKVTGRTIAVKHYENGGAHAHPFDDAAGPPYPDQTNTAQSVKAGSLSTDATRKPPKGKCFEFEAYILVHEGTTDRCFDPHIYTE